MSSSIIADDAHVAGSNELRQRLPQQPAVPQIAASSDEARQAVIDLNAAEGKAGKAEEKKRTYGRTPNGTGMLERGFEVSS